MLLSAVFIYAQRTISGTITDGDTGEGLPGVTVQIKGTSSGASTDINGSFSLSASADNVLVISYVGYITQEITIGNRTTIDVVLAPDTELLEEVVVIGYGEVRKTDLTGAVAAVGSDDLVKGLVVAPDQALQGKIAGVQVINNSGQPGGSTTVRVRGNASIRTGNTPLFVVDGVQLTGISSRPGSTAGGVGSTISSNPLNFINPNDIESIQVLKDASAAAIYGSRGANGVVLITTKKGSAGETQVNINSQVGFSNVLNEYDILSASEYRSALDEFGVTATDADGGANTDAFDAILRSALTHTHSVSLSGGSEDALYRLSVGHHNQEGIIIGNSMVRTNLNLSGTFNFLDDRASVDVFLINSVTEEIVPQIGTNSGFQGSLIGNALQWNPTYPLRDTNGNILVSQPGVAATTINPLALDAFSDDISDYTDLVISISPSYKITDNLTYRINYNYARGFGERRTQFNQALNIQGIEGIGQAAFGEKLFTNQIITQTLNYNADISSTIKLNALVGYEYQERQEDTNATLATNFSIDGDYFNFLQNADEIIPFVDAEPIQKLSSVFARAIFNIDDTYLLTATVRRDGSSKFGSNNRNGVFPSIGAAWNVHKSLNLPADELKLRLGWGQTGNSEFEAGASQTRWALDAAGGFAQENVANPDLQWETSTTINIGVDFSLFDYKLTGSIDYFDKRTEDLLFQQQVIAPGPASLYWLNLPGSEVQNNGLEILLNYNVIDNGDFTWDFGVNASFLNNELTKYSGANVLYGQVFGQGASNARIHRLEEGQPLNAFYMQQFTGLDDAGLSTFEDPAYVGDPNQDVLLGINTKATYKKFTFNLAFNGAFGHDIYNNTLMTVLPITNLGTRNIAGSLVGSGESTANAIQPSSRYLEKGDYLKLNNATIGYNVGQIGAFKNVRFYITGNNLFVITNYSGFDPEVNTPNVADGLPSYGIEYIPYPSARSYMLGVNLSL